jgi:hypothetical protein
MPIEMSCDPCGRAFDRNRYFRASQRDNGLSAVAGCPAGVLRGATKANRCQRAPEMQFESLFPLT